PASTFGSLPLPPDSPGAVNTMNQTLLRIACGCCLGAWAFGATVTAAPPETFRPKAGQAKSAIDYGRHIRPILSNNSCRCPGPDEKERKADLRLDLREAALQTAESGKAVIAPGKPRESELIDRITAKTSDRVMPPPASKKKLTPQEIDLLTQW